MNEPLPRLDPMPRKRSSVVMQAIKGQLQRTGFYDRILSRMVFPGVAILCYHGFREDNLPPGSIPFEDLHTRRSEFREQCELLSRSCHPISLRQFCAARAGGAALPKRPVLLTFDDGYRSVAQIAAPILKEFRVPAAVFLCSNPIEQQVPYWYDAAARAWGEGEVELLKRVPYDRWQRIVRELPSTLREIDPCGPMTVQEVQKLSAEPLVELGAHTHSHPILAQAEPAEQKAEIQTNIEKLSSWIGKPILSFAYPNGRPGEDYTAETVRVLRELGVQSAFTTHTAFSRNSEDLLELSRFLMLDGVSGCELAHRLCFSWRS